MKRYLFIYLPALACALLFPSLLMAQGLPSEATGLNGVLQRLFTEMMPLCRPMVDVGRALGGFAALWYISVRVWRHLSRAEAIDFYPLLRPFAIGLAIMMFPALINLMNGVLEPTVKITRNMSKNSQEAILYHILNQEQEAKQTPPPASYPGSDNGDWDKYEQPDNTNNNGSFPGFGGLFSLFSFKNMFKAFITAVVEVCFEAAALCINTIRTFYLIILVILGPLVLSLSIFDGFQQSLVNWFARYINIFMWLPVANIFGGITSKILENMMTLDQDFFSSTAYIIFMLIAIVGYFTVPSVANYIIHASGQNTLLHKVNNMAMQGAQAVAGKLI